MILRATITLQLLPIYCQVVSPTSETSSAHGFCRMVDLVPAEVVEAAVACMAVRETHSFSLSHACGVFFQGGYVCLTGLNNHMAGSLIMAGAWLCFQAAEAVRAM